MKSFYKRVIAAALCLALIAAFIPASALAQSTENPNAGNIVPGKVIVRLKEAYDGNISELFPYLEIEAIEDIYLSVIISSGKPIDEISETIRERIGTTFAVTLAEKTESAVYEAIALLTEDSRVKYAEPDHVVGLDEDNDDEDEAPADLLEAFAEYFSELYDRDIPVSSVGLGRGYGWFGGCYLANLYSYGLIVIDDFEAKMIGGYLFGQYQMDDSMILYKDGKAYSLEQAYDGGIISDEAFALVADALNADIWIYRQSIGDITYALIILRCAVKLNGKPTPMMVEKFDVDGDGEITVGDALFALRVAAGLVTVYGD